MRFTLHAHLHTLLTQAGIAAHDHSTQLPCLDIAVAQWTAMAKLASEAKLRLVALWAEQEGDGLHRACRLRP